MDFRALLNNVDTELQVFQDNLDSVFLKDNGLVFLDIVGFSRIGLPKNREGFFIWILAVRVSVISTIQT